jgi:hypothetical protein
VLKKCAAGFSGLCKKKLTNFFILSCVKDNLKLHKNAKKIDQIFFFGFYEISKLCFFHHKEPSAFKGIEALNLRVLTFLLLVKCSPFSKRNNFRS